MTRDLERAGRTTEHSDHLGVDFSLGHHCDPGVSRATEPGAPDPRRRVDAMRRLSDAGIPHRDTASRPGCLPRPDDPPDAVPERYTPRSNAQTEQVLGLGAPAPASRRCTSTSSARSTARPGPARRLPSPLRDVPTTPPSGSLEQLYPAHTDLARADDRGARRCRSWTRQQWDSARAMAIIPVRRAHACTSRRCWRQDRSCSAISAYVELQKSIQPDLTLPVLDHGPSSSAPRRCRPPPFWLRVGQTASARRALSPPSAVSFRRRRF